MKVILVDNYARETVADILHAENLNEKEAEAAAHRYNLNRRSDDERWARVVSNEYRLSRGMEDLI